MDEASQLAVVTSIILERPTCLLCITAKAGEDKLAVIRAMDSIGTTIRVDGETGERCRACGSTLRPVYSLIR